jgi:MFS family permease
MAVQSVTTSGTAAETEEAASTNPFLSAKFRVWWAASVFAGAGVGIQTVVVPLFIRDRVADDNRAIAIAGALVSMQIMSAFFSLIGGVVADRHERRRVLVQSQAVAAAVSIVYVVLSALEVGIVWPVYPLAMALGTAAAFTNPARQSMVPQLLSRSQLQNGIILGNIAFMAFLQFGGPTAGGILADTAGLTAAFAVQTASLVVAMLLFSRVQTDRPAPSGRNVRGDLADGLRYVAKSPRLISLLTIGAVPGIFVMGPFTVTLVLMVEDVYRESDAFVGYLWGAFGGGILLGSLLLTVRQLPRRGLFTCLCLLVGGLVFAAYGTVETPWVAIALLVVQGMVGPAVFMNTVVALLQEYTPGEMMGRVMSMYTLTFVATSPIGYGMAGGLASAFGPQWTLVFGGLATAALGLACILFLKPLRQLD